MRAHRSWRVLAFLGLAAPLALPAPAVAQGAVAQFYRGRQITIVIGSSVGGGYDSYARVLARHLGDHMPGHPTIVPTNMPGAGSNKAIYYIQSVAPKDGTAMGAIFSDAILDPLIGAKPAPIDPSKLIYVGSANTDVFLCMARGDAAVQTFQDAFTKPITLAASAEGGSTRDYPAMLNNLLGTKFHIASGYPGTREMTLAVEQGEVQGQCGIAWSSLSTLHPDWVRDGKVRILAQEAIQGLPEIDRLGAPLTLSFAKDDTTRQIMSLVYSQEIFGRPYVLPPGVPADRVAALRKAFLETLQDPATVADAKRNLLDIRALSGEAVQALVAKAYATPRAIVELTKQSLLLKQ